MKNHNKDNIKFFEVFNGENNTLISAIRVEVIPNDEHVFSKMDKTGDFDFSPLINGYIYYVSDLKNSDLVYSNPTKWPKFEMMNVHNYIIQHWDILQSGEFINLYDTSVERTFLDEIKYEYTANVLILKDNSSFVVSRTESNHSDFCNFMNNYCDKIGGVTWYISQARRLTED